jgi:predicted O-methyltransferase YrrM
MEIVNEQIEEYARLMSAPESDLLKKLNRETHAMVLQPRMLSGHLQGRFLSFISKLLQPQLIVEIGTYTGYSALCLAEGLSVQGKLITIDVNEELESFTNSFFKESLFASQIDYRIADAQFEIPKITDPIDLVFIDADKKNNQLYFDLLIDKVRPGGIIMIDNVLWSGKIIDELANDKSTKALKEFNAKCAIDPRVEQLMLPLRDGILILRKK